MPLAGLERYLSYIYRANCLADWSTNNDCCWTHSGRGGTVIVLCIACFQASPSPSERISTTGYMVACHPIFHRFYSMLHSYWRVFHLRKHQTAPLPPQCRTQSPRFLNLPAPLCLTISLCTTVFQFFFVHVWLRAVRCEVMSDRRQLQRSARKAEKYEGTAPAWSVRRHAVARASKYISSAIKRHVHRTHKLSRGARAADVVHPRYRTGVIPSVSFY